MACPECGEPTVSFAIPAAFREHAPEGASMAAICTGCLVLSSTDAAPDDPEFAAIHEGFPAGEAAVPMALAVGLLESLALNRRDIAALFEAVEAAGVDPFLVVDRLAAAESVQPPYGMARRRQQLEQLL